MASNGNLKLFHHNIFRDFREIGRHPSYYGQVPLIDISELYDKS